MKSILIFTLAFGLIAQIGYSQPITCPGQINGTPTTLDFGPVTCGNNGNIDFLSVTLNVVAANDCSIDIEIYGLPDDVSVDGTDIMANEIAVYSGFSYNLSIPSDNCAPVNYSVSIESVSGCGECEFENLTLQLTPTIPTLSQWGLILLSLICLVFGVIYIRRINVKEAIN